MSPYTIVVDRGGESNRSGQCGSTSGHEAGV